MASLTLSYLLYALFVFVVFRLIYALHRSRQFQRFAKANGCGTPHDISGPWPFSILSGFAGIRRVMRMKQTGEDILDDIVLDMFKDATTIQQTNFDGTVQFTTIEPANIQAMLATQFKDFELGERRNNTFFPLLRKSIFSSDGSYWEHSRALFRPTFNREAINDLDETEAASQALMRAIGPASNDGWTEPCDLQSLFFDFTLDTATAFLFGESVQSLSISRAATSAASQQATTKQFKDDFELASKYMINRIRAQNYYWMVDGLKFRRAISRIRKFTEHFVQKAIDSAASEKTSDKKYDLLSALATQTRDRDELRDQTMAILLAGRDTTASLLGWVFLRLTLHPEILTKLRSEIVLLQPTDPITFTSLKSCRYLQHFINEVLRLHPTVPFNNRQAARTTTLPHGGSNASPIAVEKGQTVAFSVYLMHRRRDLWGSDALEFRPERWSERKIPAWHFAPFSGGPRICLGQQFALTEVGFVIVKLLREFDGIEAVDLAEMGRMRKMLGLTMWPADGVKVRLRRARAITVGG